MASVVYFKYFNRVNNLVMYKGDPKKAQTTGILLQLEISPTIMGYRIFAAQGDNQGPDG